MVSKVEKPGLLSKVARFVRKPVRNPVRDRSEIIQQHGTDSVSNVKQALTFMMGRKRKNDVVRKLEFDQLRILQQRDRHGQDDAFQSSFFHTHASNMASGAATMPHTLANAAGALYTPQSRAFADTEPMPLPGVVVMYLEEQEEHPPAWLACASSQPQSGVWVCPARLSAADVPVLNTSLAASAMPGLLDWHALREITADAVAPLDAWFAAWFAAAYSQRVPVPLRFTGTGALLASLRSLAPAGNRSVDRNCWNLRLHVLCALGLQDEFDLAALDYCMTYESAPAEWQDASCRIEQVSEPVLETTPQARQNRSKNRNVLQAQ